MLHETVDDLGIVVRRGPEPHLWHIRGVPDEPLTRRELIILLVQNGITPEEIGLMLTEFQLNPDANEACFGILGQFLFVGNYIMQGD